MPWVLAQHKGLTRAPRLGKDMGCHGGCSSPTSPASLATRLVPALLKPPSPLLGGHGFTWEPEEMVPDQSEKRQRSNP